VADGADLFDRIRRLLDESGLDPTPSHYEFFYRYATGADPQLTEAVDAIRRSGGAIRARTIATLRRELYGIGSVGRLLDDAESQLARMGSYLEQSETDARSYRRKLGASRSHLDATTDYDRQRAMLAEMIEATNAMLDATAQLQSELTTSSREVDKLRADLEIARVESRTDPLTGLFNRKACIDYLDAQILRARSEDRPLSLIFLDIDHFKRFNDSFGHRMGDEVLRLVAQRLEQFFHGRGFVARWGGEEFVTVVPGDGAREATAAAERFRRDIASRTLRTRTSDQEVGRITLSLGVAALQDEEDAQALIDRADQALYDAKADGRDRVVCWHKAA